MALQVQFVGNAVILENQKVSENGRTIADKIGMGQPKAWNRF
jgi:hypothetical protein